MLSKWHTRAERGDHADPPVDFLEALCDDMNTPRAISLMHGYYARREGEKLYAAMLFLGLIPGSAQKSIRDLEVKTEPQCEEQQALGVTL
jgi:cysteinyl-tRNA synthetase